MAVAVGRRAAGLAHRVLGDGRGPAGPRASTSTAAGPTSCSRTTRTRRRRRWRRAGAPLARLWMHNGMLQVAESAEKMSKSVGNIQGLAEVLDEFGRDAVILYFVQGHYRQPIVFSRERMEEAGRGVRAHPRSGAPAGSGRLSCGPRAAARALLRRLGRRLQHSAARSRRCSTGSARPTGARGWGDADLREMLGILGLDDLLDAGGEEAPAEVVALVAAAYGRARGARLGRGRPPARRGARCGLGDPGRPGRPRARCRSRDRLRPQRGSRGPAGAAPRGPRTGRRGAGRRRACSR